MLGNTWIELRNRLTHIWTTEFQQLQRKFGGRYGLSKHCAETIGYPYDSNAEPYCTLNTKLKMVHIPKCKT